MDPDDEPNRTGLDCCGGSGRLRSKAYLDVTVVALLLVRFLVVSGGRLGCLFKMHQLSCMSLCWSSLDFVVQSLVTTQYKLCVRWNERCRRRSRRSRSHRSGRGRRSWRSRGTSRASTSQRTSRAATTWSPPSRSRSPSPSPACTLSGAGSTTCPTASGRSERSSSRQWRLWLCVCAVTCMLTYVAKLSSSSNPLGYPLAARVHMRLGVEF